MDCEGCGRSYDDHRFGEDTYGAETDPFCYSDEAWAELELEREVERVTMIRIEAAACAVLRDLMPSLEAFDAARSIAQRFHSVPAPTR